MLNTVKAKSSFKIPLKSYKQSGYKLIKAINCIVARLINFIILIPYFLPAVKFVQIKLSNLAQSEKFCCGKDYINFFLYLKHPAQNKQKTKA